MDWSVAMLLNIGYNGAIALFVLWNSLNQHFMLAKVLFTMGWCCGHGTDPVSSYHLWRVSSQLNPLT